MNPLNHFGIKSQFIRGDTTSYNMAGDEYCNECGEFRGHPNTRDENGKLVFVCSHCKRGENMRTEIAERKFGA